MSDNIVNRIEFNEKFKSFYSGQKSNRSVWDKERLQAVIQVLKEFEGVQSKKSAAYYHCSKKYELFRLGGECHVILKRSKENRGLIFIIAAEDHYEKLLEAHIQTGHGGRDKMLYYIKNKWKVSKQACEIFVKCCQSCNRKKTLPQKGVVVKPLTSDGFNMRGQVDLIDFQSCNDGEYKWVMNYQDQATKFVHLRPLKSKHAVNVAEELSKIFFTWGALQILQSDNGREFVATVIKELVAIWPFCKIVHGRPRHPQSQGSVERSNADVEKMIRAWMKDKDSKNWSRGIYEVQWQKNTSKHRVIIRAPYEAVLGPIRAGLKSTCLPDEILNTLTSEEDLEQVLEQRINEIEQDLDQIGEQQRTNEIEDLEQDLGHQTTSGTNFESIPENLVEVSLSEANEDTFVQQTICGICNNILQANEVTQCGQCTLSVHINCTELDLSTENGLKCLLCVRGRNLINGQKDCFLRQKAAAEKMKTFSEERFQVLNVGECITLSIPDVDRGPLDFKNIFGVITNFENGVYQIGTKDGLIKGWFPRTEIQKSGTNLITINDVPKNTQLTLREAAAKQSLNGGQGFKKCNCKSAVSQCQTKRCICFKSGILCNCRCHQSSACCNK